LGDIRRCRSDGFDDGEALGSAAALPLGSNVVTVSLPRGVYLILPLMFQCEPSAMLPLT
jgi:hypothetical protein